MLKRVRQQLYLWAYPLSPDLRNILRYGRGCHRMEQLLYCDPRGITLHVRHVSTVLPDACATVPPALAFPSRTLWERCVDGVAAGDWDLKTVPLAEVLPYRLTRDKLAGDLSWQACGEYARMQQIIAILGVSDGCRTPAELDARYAALDRLIEDVRKTRRLKSQRELNPVAFRERHGINVAIGRHGDIIKLEGGTHRLAIAHHFGLHVIPVCVRIVHPDALRNGSFKRLSDASGQLATRHDALEPAAPATAR